MSKKATTADAQLILQLYDLRREAEMRRARHWWTFEFSPLSVEDFMKVLRAAGSQENNWMRQVAGYWSMAASFVFSGALNEELFLQPAVSGEMFVMFAKVYPFLAELRKEVSDPELFLQVEKVIMHTKWGRDRLKFVLKRMETARAKLAEQAKT